VDKQEKIRRIITSEQTDGEQRSHYLATGKDSFADPQRFFQRYPRLYTLIRQILSPTATFHHWKREVPDPGAHTVINLGCGCDELHPDLINVDMVKFTHVDLVADFAGPLPMRSDSVDGAIAIALLEHLENPKALVIEVGRVLKPGGTLFIAVPFLYPFHAAPGDYTRWTIPGLKVLLGNSFEVVASGNRGGTMGVIILSLAHALSQILCFGSLRFYSVLNFAFLGLLTPLRILDLVLGYLPFATNLSPNVYVTARKRG